MVKWISITPERTATLINEISSGSQPAIRFYVMMTISAFIASFGLTANNTAIIIGAMLVAPLMVPIFGMSLAMVRGNVVLLARALKAVLVGIIIAVISAAAYGLLPVGIEVTSEMLARTRPNLLDLFVAILAGFAGSYATVDERLSPGLPGVAIAVSLVPPLANTGLCLAAGAYSGASGSFLLFMANYFSIVVVSSIVFYLAGLSRKSLHDTRSKVIGGITVTIIGFIIIAVFLTNSLVGIVKDRQLRRAIERSLTANLSLITEVTLENIIYDFQNEKLYIHATARASKVFAPHAVKAVQDALSNDVKAPVELIIRTLPFKDMSATGSTDQVTEQNLDGFFLSETMTPKDIIIRVAEQVLWEELSKQPGFEVLDVDLKRVLAGNVVIATIKGFRELYETEIRHIEAVMQTRLKDNSIDLVISLLPSSLMNKRGRIMYEWVYFKGMTPEKEKIMDKINYAVDKAFNTYPDVFPVNVNYILKEDHWKILVEAVGARVMTPKDVVEINRKVSADVAQPLKIYIWTRTDAVVTEKGFASFEDFTRKEVESLEEELQKVYLENSKIEGRR